MTDSCHMRRQDRRITDSARIDSILAQGRYVTLALADGDDPYAVTLSYGFDAAARVLYFHVAHKGYKLDVISRNPRACGTVILDGGYTKGECEHPFESIVMRGRLRVLESAKEKRHAIEVLVSSLEDDADTYWSSRTWTLDSRLDSFTALAFDIDSLDAKAGK